MIEEAPGADWHDLQEWVAAILRECGLVAEVGKTLRTVRGTVEIDVHAVDPMTNPSAVYLCECKRWRSRVPQAEVQAFRTILADAGAHVGLFISSSGFQAGAFEVAAHTNVSLLSWSGFQELFIERWCDEYWVPTLRTRGDRLAGYVDPVSSDACIRHFNGEPIEPREAVGLFVTEMWGDPFNPLSKFTGARAEPLVPAIWKHRDLYRKYLPKAAAEAKYLRGLLDALLAVAQAHEQECK